jgi:hypothetical protein
MCQCLDATLIFSRGELDKLSEVMTKAQIEEGKKRGNDWDQSHRKK